ncbi:hypothetical protein PHYPSEUDO_009955 [Phytophthora pseudosyringae]|uniref:Uncharacterized protein n=1 Tax=Phytophthora pseudosyringae TaxID=221518 RepID=A0A8T1VEI7_9STRA|nr:hypothetical protein PHYPSEUDO_009955 [Phytophthora pseudosyringae]
MPLFSKVMDVADEYNDKATEFAQQRVAQREEGENQPGNAPKHKSIGKKTAQVAEEFVAKRGNPDSNIYSSSSSYANNGGNLRDGPDNFHRNKADGSSSISSRAGYNDNYPNSSSIPRVHDEGNTYNSANKSSLDSNNSTGLVGSSTYRSSRDEVDRDTERYSGDLRNGSRDGSNGSSSSSSRVGTLNNSNLGNTSSSYPTTNLDHDTYGSSRSGGLDSGRYQSSNEYPSRSSGNDEDRNYSSGRRYGDATPKYD